MALKLSQMCSLARSALQGIGSLDRRRSNRFLFLDGSNSSKRHLGFVVVKVSSAGLGIPGDMIKFAAKNDKLLTKLSN